MNADDIYARMASAILISIPIVNLWAIKSQHKVLGAAQKKNIYKPIF